MRLTETADLWWKNAVVYCVDVETFQDGNGDGVGDFPGLTQRLDHLVRLGVTCLWLMPFHPTRERDDGYDITDYYAVDPRLGTLGEFTEFVRTARDRGLRVIADLVVNHTSDHHPWFRDACSGRDAARRDWYVWCDTPPEDGPRGVTFPDAEQSLWQYHEPTGQYYFHHFYKEQPDLNITNAEVRDEIARIMGFWTQLGLSGFRVDAVPFLLETAGQVDADDLPDPHAYLADLRSFLGRRNGEAMLLGEVNLPYDETLRFFGDPASGGDELTMCFDFIGMQRMYLSLAREQAAPLADALRGRPQPPRWPTRCAGGRSRPATRTGRRSCATTTNSPSTSSPRPSATRSSRRSAPRRTCGCTAGACAAGCPPCSAATGAGSNSPTACCSPCRARRCSSTARRSAWARTSPPTGGSPSAPPCSGPRGRRRASPAPTRPVTPGR
ncbi:hypothetical protein Kpho02_37150 [Kitasatospora phosalacinea]|uniref:Glycosyl hydrolase family 13 catalytic domain-containing protein n=1 Tax=Kitasatospora phosalacinea TaxID=2065 RepID=A0A9W6V183_9ACTN|nr:alpha-amylase family glycosyl hydrolase [Kitasatospora phosalacinea]GLW71416.1 hypothetical protein Kpho02_37150 [Kitasatospora phosalacinea]